MVIGLEIGQVGFKNDCYQEYRDIQYLCILREVWTLPTILYGVWLGSSFIISQTEGEGKNIGAKRIKLSQRNILKELKCVCCGFWPPVSLACPNYEVVGLQHQSVANTEPRLYTPPQMHFQDPPLQSIHVRYDKNEGHTMGTFFLSSHNYLIPSRYDYDDTRRMIRVTYRDEGWKIGGNWYAVIRNLLPRWIGWGTCSPTNKQPKNWPLPGSGRIRYHALA